VWHGVARSAKGGAASFPCAIRPYLHKSRRIPFSHWEKSLPPGEDPEAPAKRLEPAAESREFGNQATFSCVNRKGGL
jgi:hypothetical protein